MDLAQFLEQTGFRRIPLSRNGVGYFHAAATLNGRPVEALLDTGGGSTVVSLTVAHEMGLSMTKLDTQGGGAGAARLDVYLVDGADLRLGDLTPRLAALLAMDLSHANAALARKGEPPIEVIVGVDAFAAHDAVIDYGSSALFLLP
jgi:aspartyl protease